MALKDWKKVTENKSFTTWRRNEENMFLTLHRQEYNPEAWGYKKPIDFWVSIGGASNKIMEDQHFKTKTEAMVYAHKYMRTH